MANTDIDILEYIFDNFDSIIVESNGSSMIEFKCQSVKFNLYGYTDSTAYLYSAGERLDIDPATVYALFEQLTTKAVQVAEIKRKTKLDAQREKLGLPVGAESSRPATPTLENVLNRGKNPSPFEKFKSWMLR